MTAFFWALLAASCWGIAPLFEKFGLRGTSDPSMGVLVPSVGVLIGAAGFLPFLSSTQWHSISWRTGIFLAIGGILASIVGQLCFYHALKQGAVSQVVPIAAAYPVLACLLGVLILKESLTPGRMAGIALVMSGVFLLR